MKKTYETFFIAGKKVGGIIRLLESEKLSTLTCFQIPDGPLIHLEHRFYFTTSAFEWERYEFSEYHENKTIAVDRRENIAIDCVSKEVQSLTKKTIPSYATFLLLTEIIEKNLSSLDFDILIDGNPIQAPRSVIIKVEQPKKLQLQSGEIVMAARVPLIIEGQTNNQHWIAEGRILKSDWQGAESFAANSIDEVLVGLGPRETAIISSFN